MIRVMATDDGTYTVYRDRIALLHGLTRDQADEFAKSQGQALHTAQLRETKRSVGL